MRRVLVLMLFLGTACGGGGGDGGAPDEPGGGAPAGPLVVLARYGGPSGVHERVSVDAYGRATIVSERSPAPAVRTLSSSELATLRIALERSEITTLDRNYLDPRAVDAYQYDLTYQGVTVTADEGVLPSGLRPVVDQLTELLA